MSSNFPSSVPSRVFTPLPLMECKHCGIKVIVLRSKAGDVFYKCPNNIRGDPTTCDQYWFEPQYLNHLKEKFPHLVPPNYQVQNVGNVVPPLAQSSAVFRPVRPQPNNEL